MVSLQQRNLEEAQGAADFDAYSKELNNMTRKKSVLDAEMESVDNDIMETQKTAQIRSVINTKLQFCLFSSGQSASGWLI